MAKRLLIFSILLLIFSSYNFCADQQKPLSKEDMELIEASKKGQFGEVERLLKNRANPNAKYNQYTALFYATMHNYPKIIKLLFDYGANVNEKFWFGRTALMNVIGYDAAKELLNNPNININLTHESGHTALFSAVSAKKYNIVELLLDRPEIIIDNETFARALNDDIMQNLFNCYKNKYLPFLKKYMEESNQALSDILGRDVASIAKQYQKNLKFSEYREQFGCD